MFASIRSSCVVGLDAVAVDVEVNLRNGQPRFSIIGLGGAAVRESRERILSALEYAGFNPPEQILVNLAPAEVRKESSVFDLPIALAILVAMGVVSAEVVLRTAFCGELSLTGDIKIMMGAAAHSLQATSGGSNRIFVPFDNGPEASFVPGLEVIPVKSIGQVLRILERVELPECVSMQNKSPVCHPLSLRDVVGQANAKRAFVVAAAGGHNMLMIGPPGCGKSMMAERLPELLPELSLTEMVEVVKIHSVAGQSTLSLLRGVRPFRSPHHVISEPGLIGGGSGPRPGEISLAHRGVLFLDEFPEFRRGTLEALRSPLETGRVQLSRARASVFYPARFQLIAAMNPCPCGRLGVGRGSCKCSHYSIRDYMGRLSQPILDRIDLQVELEAVDLEDFCRDSIDQLFDVTSAKHKVAVARERQLDRFGCLNSETTDSVLRSGAGLLTGARDLLTDATRKLGVSARGYMRMLRVARTIADLSDQGDISENAVAEAVGYRSLERLNNLLQGGTSVRHTGPRR